MNYKKSFLAVICIVISCLVLCSCGAQKQIYINDSKLNFNYNNITAGSSPYWICDDAVYYKEHNAGFDIYKTDKSGTTKIDTVSCPESDIQLYNDKLYYFDQIDNQYVFSSYNIQSNIKETVATVETERIYNYFILNDILFVTVGNNDNLVKDLQIVMPDSTQRTEKTIFACGVVDQKLYLVTNQNNSFSIFEYDAAKKIKKEVGSFGLPQDITIDDTMVNFGAENVLFVTNYEDQNKSIISVYNFVTNMVDVCTFYGCIEDIVAYKDYAFVCTSHTADLSGSKTMYHFDLKTKEKSEIQKLDGDIDIFVGSDKEVYVSSSGFEGIRRYGLNGKYGDVLKNQ